MSPATPWPLIEHLRRPFGWAVLSALSDCTMAHRRQHLIRLRQSARFLRSTPIEDVRGQWPSRHGCVDLRRSSDATCCPRGGSDVLDTLALVFPKREYRGHGHVFVLIPTHGGRARLPLEPCISCTLAIIMQLVANPRRSKDRLSTSSKRLAPNGLEPR